MKLNYSLKEWACYVLHFFLLYLTMPAVAQQVARTAPATISNITGYYEYLPTGYASNPGVRYPLIIFLHGVGQLAGSTATQLSPSVLGGGLPSYISQNKFPAAFQVGAQSYSFIVLTPQFKVWPGSDDVHKLLAYARTQYRVDTNRVYVTGLSMGGGVAWGAISEDAKKASQYAAAAIICGAWDPDARPGLAGVIATNNTPVWALHNDNDPTVSATWSRNWVKLINANIPAPNPAALLTIFPSTSHDAWTKAYDPAYKDPQTGSNIYEWMLRYSKAAAPNPGTGGKRIIVKPSRGRAIYYEDAMTALKVQPGDTLCINAGDYDYIHMGNLVGTAAKPIIITNCGGLVRVGVNSTTTVAAFLLPGSQHFKVEGNGHPGVQYGFDINGTSNTGVKLFGMLFSAGATEFEVHHCYIHDAGMFLQAKTLQNCRQPQFLEGAFVMRNVKIHDLLCRNSAWEGFYIGNTHYLWDDGNCKDLKSHHLENLEVYNNDLENMGSDGIQIAMADMGQNLVHHNRVANYAMARNSAHGYGILSGGGTSLRIYNNRVDRGFSPGIQLFGTGVSYVYNNVISNIYYEGINVSDKLLFQPVTGYIYNNTIFNTGSLGIKIYADLTTVGHKVYNNVVVAPGSPWDYPQSGYYIRGSRQILFDFQQNINYNNAKQGAFADSASGNYRLTAASSAVNFGRNMQDLGLVSDFDGNDRPQDTKYDAGAFEYMGAAASNIAPTANAGKDTVISAPAAIVNLDGRASKDIDGTISSYSWSKLSGPVSGVIVSAGSSLTLVNALVPGTYVFELVVTDNLGATGKSRVTVNVQSLLNKAPISAAGTDMTVTLPTNTAALVGSNSLDQDGLIVKYAWTKISGPAAGTINIPDASNTEVTGLVAGVYVFDLTVTDNSGATGSDRITITVINPGANKPPVARAGNDISIQLPTNTTQLDGSGSTDPDGTISSWLWKKISGPAGGNISSAGTPKTGITGLQAGTYVFELTVTDNAGAISSDRVTVTVVPVPNQVPVASAGNDITLQLPTNTTQLDGSVSTDPDGKIVSWQWTKMSGPGQGDISFPDRSITQLTGLAAGVYVFELKVTDDGGLTATDEVTVTVLAAPVNRPPVVTMASTISVQLPVNSSLLDGSASIDPDGSIVKWLWVKVNGPAGGDISSINTAKTTINNLQAGIYLYELQVTDDAGAVASGRVTVTVIKANQPPVANAGTDISISLPANTAQLDGSASKDVDGRIVKWQWTKVSGPAAGTIGQPNSSTTPLTGLVAGIYVFELTVTDDTGLSGTDRVSVVVLATGGNRPPVARAGNDISIILPVNTVQLDGSGSSDSDGRIVSWAWTQVSGPAAGTINSPNTAQTRVSGLTAGIYIYELQVTDDQGATGTARVTVTVTPANQPPVANAGSDISVQLPVSNAQLDGSASRDPDGNIAKWQWVKVSGPAGGDPTPANVANPVIGSLEAGIYIYELTVVDDGGQTATDRVQVTVVGAATNRPPIAIAGNPVTITLPVSNVQLDGSASYDPDGHIASWQWEQVSGPAQGVIVDAGLAVTAVTALQAGTYVFELTVQDGQGATSRSRVSVTVLAAPVGNQPPVAQTQGNKAIKLPINFIQADGSSSFDPDGNIARYNWRQLSGPGSANIWAADRAQTRIAGLKVGVYSFELTVTDNQGSASAATFTVTVQDADERPEVTLLYPNPARDYIKLQVSHRSNTNLRISIYDLSGKVHYTHQYASEDGLQKMISIGTIPTGHYVVEVRGEDKYRWTGHFTKVP